MKNKILHNLLVSLVIFAIITGISGCSDLKMNNGGTYVSFSAQTRTIFPKVKTVNELGNFSLMKIEKCKTENGDVTELQEVLCSWNNYSDFASAKVEIIPGIYSFVLDSSYCGTKYVCRINDVEILPERNNILDFKLKVTEYSKQTKGSVDIALFLPQKSGFTVTACLLDAELQPLEAYPEKSITVNEYADSLNKAFYTADNVQSGNYFIKFSLFMDGCPLNTVYESITVADSLVTEGSIELTADEIEKLYYVDLIIPSEAVLNSGSVTYCFSRNRGLTLPTTEDFIYDGFEFVGWKQIIPDGDNFTFADDFSYGIEDGTVGNKEYIAVFRSVNVEQEEQEGQTPQEQSEEQPEQTPAEPAETSTDTEETAETEEPAEQEGQTPQEQSEEQPEQTPVEPIETSTDTEETAETEEPAEQEGQTPQEQSEEQPEQTPVEPIETPVEQETPEEYSEQEITSQQYSINEADYYRLGKIGRYSDYTDGSEYDYIGLLSFNGKTLVTAIENASVQNNVQLDIPEGIEIISGSAFTESLKISTSIIGPDVKCIEPHAFKNCQNMYAVTFPQENCIWYITSERCNSTEEVIANGTTVNFGTIWNAAILLKSDYEAKYWYKIEY